MAEQTEILLADDSEVGRYLIATMLRRAGFVVREVGDGSEAIREISAQPPDLAILDVKMPQLDGLETCRRLKADPITSTVPVLMLSATFRDASDRAEGLDIGADGYLTQPIEAPVLIASVRALLRARTAERAERLIATEWQVTFDAIGDAVVLVDGSGRVRRCNAAFVALADLASAEAAVDTDVRALLPALAGQPIAPAPEDPELVVGERILRLHVDELPNPEASGHAVLTLRDVTAETQLAEERERVLRRERVISTTLQQALVPRHLPDIPGLELDAKYALAESDVLLGGDWFDAIRTDTGVWLALGDIAGHGVAAAAQAVQLRHSLRLLAEDGYTPAVAMARLGELLSGGALVETASAVIVAFDLSSQIAQVVCAGHPPPIVLGADHSTRVLHEARGPLLGFDDSEREAVAVEILPGETIVLYTDGVIERRREPIDAGIERLRRAVAEDGPFRNMAERVFTQLMPEGPDDDATLLAARWVAPARRANGRRHGPLPQDIQLALPRVPATVRTMRAAASDMARAIGLADRRVDDIALAVSEAVTNSVRHGGNADTPVIMRAVPAPGALRVSIVDSGSWLGTEARERGLGLGLPLMNAVSDEFQIACGPKGTTVTMTFLVHGR